MSMKIAPIFKMRLVEISSLGLDEETSQTEKDMLLGSILASQCTLMLQILFDDCIYSGVKDG